MVNKVWFIALQIYNPPSKSEVMACVSNESNGGTIRMVKQTSRLAIQCGGRVIMMEDFD